MQIWDTAGQDKYKTITQNYYKNCNGAFVVFSIDSKDSFYSISKYNFNFKEIGSKI
jgi:GTPase SAR1 family protein